MLIKNTQSLRREGFKSKDLIFGANEQKKFNLKESYKIITNFHSGIGYEDYERDLTLIYDSENYDEHFEFTVNVERPNDVHDKKDKKWKMRIKVSNQAIGNKTLALYHNNKKRFLDKALYKIYKQGAIWLEKEINDNTINTDEDNEENEKIDENSYVSQRYNAIHDSTTQAIGDILNDRDLEKDVKKIAEYMGFKDSVKKLRGIKLSKKLKTSSGNVSYRLVNQFDLDHPTKKQYHTLKVNANIPNNQEGIDEYFNTIKHELAHVITEASDGEPKFIEFCEARDIGLSHELTFDYRYNYYVVCDDCHIVLKRQITKTDHLKSIVERGRCGRCHNDNLRLLNKEEYNDWK